MILEIEPKSLTCVFWLQRQQLGVTNLELKPGVKKMKRLVKRAQIYRTTNNEQRATNNKQRDHSRTPPSAEHQDRAALRQ